MFGSVNCRDIDKEIEVNLNALVRFAYFCINAPFGRASQNHNQLPCIMTITLLSHPQPIQEEVIIDIIPTSIICDYIFLLKCGEASLYHTC